MPATAATAAIARHQRDELRAALLARGWPARTDSRHYFTLDGITVHYAYAADSGFFAHFEGDSRIAHGASYREMLIALVRLLYPDCAEVVIA